MTARFGTFLLAFGLLLIVFFVLTDVADQPNFAYFVFGALAVIGGVLLWWRVPGGASPPTSGRFRLLKNLSNRKKQPTKKT
jgi:hypothetical protein